MDRAGTRPPPDAPKPQKFDIFQDVITQFPCLNRYTHVIRVFETSAFTPRDAYVAALRRAFDELCAAIPWLAHQVIIVDTGPGSSGHIKSAPWPDSAPPNTVVRVDKDDELPSLPTLIATEFPMSMLNPTHLFNSTGPSVLTSAPAPHGSCPAPVCAIHAVFIRGGVLVTLSTHNTMIDETGAMQLWAYLSTLMNGGTLSARAVRLTNVDRACVVPLLPPGAPLKNYTHLLPPSPPRPPSLAPPPRAEWRVFHIARAGLADLKARATPVPTPAVPSISAADALAAFCWQCVSAVRLRLRLHARRRSGATTGTAADVACCRAEDQVSQFRQPASGRAALGLGSAYLGCLTVHARSWLALGEVVGSPLSRIAALLRRDRDEWVGEEWSVRSCATFVAGVADKSQLLYGGALDPETDLCATSLLEWAGGGGGGGVPFRLGGLLGESKMLRRAGGPPVPGSLYFLPSDNPRDVQIAMCLSLRELDGLEQDPEWRRYVRRSGSGLDRFRL